MNVKDTLKNIKSTDYMTQTDCHKMMKKGETNKMYMTEKMDKTRTLEYYLCVYQVTIKLMRPKEGGKNEIFMAIIQENNIWLCMMTYHSL